MEQDAQFDLIKGYSDELERDPDSPVFVALADAFRERGLLDEALAVCQRGLKAHPSYADAHLVLGQIYTDKGEAEPAERSLETALQLEPKNAVALAAMGLVHALTGRSESAVKFLDQANFIAPEDARIAKYLDEARKAADKEARKPRKRSHKEGEAGVAHEHTDLGEKLVSELSSVEGVDAVLLLDEKGHHRATAGAGHLIDDAFACGLVSLAASSEDRDADMVGPFERLLIEAKEGSVLAARFEDDILGVVLSASAQPGPVTLSIDHYSGRDA